jgi:Holliday junction resolvase RusA-like endonuclease
MSDTIRLELPLPSHLRPNDGAKWNMHKRARLIKQTRSETALVARLAKPADCPWPLAVVEPTFHMPRRMDEDNLIAWLKPVLDGLADAGIVANDSQLIVSRPVQMTGREAGRGLWLTITREEAT